MAINNPFYGITIGATVDMSGNFDLDGALSSKSQITKMIAQSSVEMRMRGQSDLIYTTQMNQASIDMAGSYGVEGVEKVTAAVSAYAGFSSADQSKTLSIIYEILYCGGFENISFNDLTPNTMMSALSAAPQAAAAKAFGCYNDLVKKLGTNSLTKILTDDKNPDAKEVRDLYNKWAIAAQTFRNDYGEGMVVGVAWGGIGRCEMTILNQAASSAWKYGGTANFQYARTGAAVSVGATYDASGSSDTSKIKVQCVSDYMGGCVSNQVGTWYTALNDKALADVAGQAPLGSPPLTVTAPLPTLPDFVAPPAAEKDTTELSKDKVEDLAKVAAYDKAKALWDKMHPNGPSFHESLEDFLNKASKPDPAPMKKLRDAVGSNRLSTRKLLQPPSEKDTRRRATSAPDELRRRPPAGLLATAGAPGDSSSSDGDYVPIGIWVCKWADIFPWLATGYLNDIDDTSDAETITEFRMMEQDFLTLSKLYRYAAGLNLEIQGEPSFEGGKLIQIANEFASAVANMRAADLHEPADYQDAAVKAFDSLGTGAQAIYTLWDQVSLLRSCELGLGFMQEDKFSLQIPSTSEQVQIPGGDFNVWSSNPAPCGFDGKNFADFASFYKLLPLILPTSRKIFAFGADGGVLCESRLLVGGKPATVKNVFTPKYGRFNYPNTQLSLDIQPIELEVDASGSYLENKDKDKKIKLYPIPFSAAQGLDTWKGQSFSTNVAADEGLNSRLKELVDELENPKVASWSYSSDSLPDDWTGDTPYSPTGLRKQYFGKTKERGKRKADAALWSSRGATGWVRSASREETSHRPAFCEPE